MSELFFDWQIHDWCCFTYPTSLYVFCCIQNCSFLWKQLFCGDSILKSEYDCIPVCIVCLIESNWLVAMVFSCQYAIWFGEQENDRMNNAIEWWEDSERRYTKKKWIYVWKSKSERVWAFDDIPPICYLFNAYWYKVMGTAAQWMVW